MGWATSAFFILHHFFPLGAPLAVHVCYENLGLSEQRPRQADELPLPDADVLAALGDLVVQAVVQPGGELCGWVRVQSKM